jgi:hypothetical protein
MRFAKTDEDLDAPGLVMALLLFRLLTERCEVWVGGFALLVG